jgi:hypothetical protein
MADYHAECPHFTPFRRRDGDFLAATAVDLHQGEI